MTTSANDSPKPAFPSYPVFRLLEGWKAMVSGAGIDKAVAIAQGQAGAGVAVNCSSDQLAMSFSNA